MQSIFRLQPNNFPILFPLDAWVPSLEEMPEITCGKPTRQKPCSLEDLHKSGGFGSTISRFNQERNEQLLFRFWRYSGLM